MKTTSVSLTVLVVAGMFALGLSTSALAATCKDAKGHTYDCKISNIKPAALPPVAASKLQSPKAPVLVAKQPAKSVLAPAAKNPSLIAPNAKGNGIVASGGGNIVASGGGNIVASGGGNIKK